MRRFFLGMAIASLTAGAPLTAFGGDRDIADAIITTVKQAQIDLKGLEVDLTVENGNVVVSGSAASRQQLEQVLAAARDTDGVKSVDNKVNVVAAMPVASLPVTNAANNVVPASANEPPKRPADASSEVVSPESAADTAITSGILDRLGVAQKSGQLKNFDLDVSTVNGDVWVRGYVATPAQKALVLGTAQRIQGVRRVIDEVNVSGVRAASNMVPTQIGPGVPGIPGSAQIVGGPIAGSAPAMATPSVGGAPRPFAPSSLANGSYDGGMVNGGMMGGGVQAPQAPVPMQGGPSYGGGVPRYDQPYMPNYAWPSYAAYPNAAAVTYPKQYSASAWPYIGPFYPYPQVPLGWRRVSLEWDDGLWYLDFTHK
jgi:osmotically-inducible protein OsmY